MIETAETSFEGLKCVVFNNDRISLWITRDVGPRVLGLALDGGENLMVVLPDAKLTVEGAVDYYLRGGHRLWYAPEKPETTYIADDQPVKISIYENRLQLTQVEDQATGIQKSWQVELNEKEPQVIIKHQLTNRGTKSFEMAPWAVTMLKPGGKGLIPLQVELDDEHGLWPNRQLVFWPYTDIKSHHLQWDNRAVMIIATMKTGALKIGTPNPMGWLAYARNGILFVIKTDYQSGANYLDRGASSQIYCNPDLIELETLGPVINLAPGESTEHIETWQVYPEGSWPDEIKDLFKTMVGK